MTPSNASKPHNGDPPAYQHMQQALFKFSNNTDDSRVVDKYSSASTGKDVPTENVIEKESSPGLDTDSGMTFDPLSISLNQQGSNSHQLSAESGIVMISDSGFTKGVARQLPIAESLGTTNSITLGAADDEIKEIDARVSERIQTSTTVTMNTDNLPQIQMQERANTNMSTAKSKGAARRRGKWTVEEEEYVARVIQDFNSGFLNAPAGYTLRSYLSDKLQCDPMRITKKFTGESCIGKRVFHPAVRSAANTTAIDKAQADLDALESRWRRRLELQQRESAKKAAASVAAANAASRGTVTVQGVPVSMLGSSSNSSTDSQLQQSAVTQAATWLDRANVILMGNIGNKSQANSSTQEKSSNDSFQQLNKDETTSTHSSADDSLEHQMKEVQRLIYEGPIIQQTTADLPNLLFQASASNASTDHTNQIKLENRTKAAAPCVRTTDGSLQPPASSAHLSPALPTLEPADKRMRINGTTDINNTGAEDAEALVGFLRSVRASAAAGQEL